MELHDLLHRPILVAVAIASDYSQTRTERGQTFDNVVRGYIPEVPDFVGRTDGVHHASRQMVVGVGENGDLQLAHSAEFPGSPDAETDDYLRVEAWFA